MARARNIIFRIFYSTSYTFVFFITLAFICASPADTIYQSYRRRRNIDIGFIAGAYVITGLIAILIYASRIYTNRSVINSIPQTYMPVDRYDLPRKRIWHYISDILLKSAVVAYQAKPRSERIELESPEANDRLLAAMHPTYGKDIQVARFEPRWGPIEHSGWSSPAKDDLPNLQYATVVAELIDLIEAKAVSIASTEPERPSVKDEGLAINDRILATLSRPDTFGMRQYIAQLTSLGVISNTTLAAEFLSQYERARFAPQPLTEDKFQSLMRTFAELLRSINSIGSSCFDTRSAKINMAFTGDDHASENSVRRADAAFISNTSLSDSGIAYNSDMPPARVSEDSVPSQATDESVHRTMNSTPTRPESARRSRANTRRSSRTNASTATKSKIVSPQRPALRQQPSQASGISNHSIRSSTSAKSGRSTVSNSSSVVIRLNNNNDDQTLPYTIEMVSDGSARGSR